jgi:hypothetical protein
MTVEHALPKYSFQFIRLNMVMEQKRQMKRKGKLYLVPYGNTVFLSQITMLRVMYCSQELHVRWQTFDFQSSCLGCHPQLFAICACIRVYCHGHEIIEVT